MNAALQQIAEKWTLVANLVDGAIITSFKLTVEYQKKMIIDRS